MSPWALLGGVALLAASHGATAWWCYGAGRDAEIANRTEDERIYQQARDAAMKGAADAIAKAKQEGGLVVGQVRTITRVVPVYRECRHDDRVFDSLNRALRGEPAGGGQLPEGPGPAAGQDVRGDQRQAR